MWRRFSGLCHMFLSHCQNYGLDPNFPFYFRENLGAQIFLVSPPWFFGLPSQSGVDWNGRTRCLDKFPNQCYWPQTFVWPIISIFRVSPPIVGLFSQSFRLYVSKVVFWHLFKSVVLFFVPKHLSVSSGLHDQFFILYARLKFLVLFVRGTQFFGGT